MNVTEFADKVRSKEIDVVEHTQQALNEVKKINREYHYFTAISEDLALQQATSLQKNISNNKGSLLGLPISIKDAICVKGVESTASSRVLNSYKPVFNATIVNRITSQGGIIIGKTVHDEFGFGGFSTNVGLDYTIPLNPFDKKRSCGGSSGGAAGFTQKSPFPHIAIAESTGGSIVEPASFCGVFGLCPTYGKVSRYGLMDYANSLDKIGPMAKNTHDLAVMMDVIGGYDERDSTSLADTSSTLADSIGKDPKSMKVGIIKETFDGLSTEIATKMKEGISLLEQQGVVCEEVSLPLPLKYGIPTYYLISTSEASTNLAKYCGMRYGNSEELKGTFNEYFSEVRSKHFGAEAKRRIILGTFARMSGYRDAYYLKALKVRTKITQAYQAQFSKFDALLSPTAPLLPPTFDEINNMTPLQQYQIDVMTVSPNVAGLPHLSVPLKSKLPLGMLLTANHHKEDALIKLGGFFDA